jgi:hypothetical protein
MAFLEDTIGGIFEGGAATGVVIGAGVLLLAPGLLPTIGRMVRPLAVGVVKTGMVVYSQTVATLREAGEDIIAEARAELEAEGRSAHTEPERRRSRAAETPA